MRVGTPGRSATNVGEAQPNGGGWWRLPSLTGLLLAALLGSLLGAVVMMLCEWGRVLIGNTPLTPLAGQLLPSPLGGGLRSGAAAGCWTGLIASLLSHPRRIWWLVALAGLLISGGGYLLPRIEYLSRPGFLVIVAARMLAGLSIGLLLALLVPLLPMARESKSG